MQKIVIVVVIVEVKETVSVNAVIVHTRRIKIFQFIVTTKQAINLSGFVS